MSELTLILSELERGQRESTGRLLPLVYEELRRLAAQHLAREKSGHTLQPTALVHEAYVRLLAGDSEPTGWEGRRHFFAAAAEAMRRILIDHARSKHRLKRGGQLRRHDVTLVDPPSPERSEDLLALDEALERFAGRDPVKAELVKLRFFAGLTQQQAAEALGISTATADRYWAYARAWLYRELVGRQSPALE